TSCGTDVELGDRPQYRFGTNNLTLFVFDAQSGGVLDGVTVTVQVGENTLTGEFAGNAYIVTGIPNGSFPVTISAEGFLPVTGVQNFNGGDDITSEWTEPSFQTFTVAMFPVLSVSDDVVVKVYDGNTGTLISSGEVSTKIDLTATIGSLAGAGTSPFSGTVGFTPSTINITITGGTATLPRAQLVYGATYDITVTSARNAQNQYLTPKVVDNFKAGTDFPQVVVFMGPPAIEPVALSANNENGGTQSNLTVTFPYPVVLCALASPMTWVNTVPAGTIAPATVNPVTATLGSGGTQLTLVYNIQGADDTAQDLRVRFDNVGVRVSGGATCENLNAVSLRGTATNVNTNINVRDVP
ncbi:MAG TPA: hypothetical protein VLC93_15935, partial [Myxococcota bacterium]|nr:hypothetical protein [Myxococcota bacterium]